MDVASQKLYWVMSISFAVAGVVEGTRRQSTTITGKSDYVKKLERGHVVEVSQQGEGDKVLETVVSTDWFNMLVTVENGKVLSADVIVLPGTLIFHIFLNCRTKYSSS